MQARMKNPVLVLPETLQALLAVSNSLRDRGLSENTMDLVHLRVSQINCCSVCTDMGFRKLQKDGETMERIVAVSAWRETPYFSDAERAALALGEAVTRLADRPDAVTDEIWKASLAHARPGRWVAQRFFQAKAIDDAGSIVNHGVFLVAGQACGLYARVQVGPTDDHALSAPVLVEGR